MAIDNPKVNIMAILVEFLKTILTTNKWKASGEKLSMSIQTGNLPGDKLPNWIDIESFSPLAFH